MISNRFESINNEIAILFCKNSISQKEKCSLCKKTIKKKHIKTAVWLPLKKIRLSHMECYIKWIDTILT
jgi:hypothetical protein